MARFALKWGVGPLTVRRAIAAERFAARLAAAERLASRQALDNVPVTLVEAIQRIERFSPGEVDRLLPLVLSGGVNRERLLKVEAGLRRDAARDPSPVPSATSDGGGGYRRRMRAKSFETALLERLSSPNSPFDGRLILRCEPGCNAPVPCDAIVECEVDNRFYGLAIRIRTDTNSRSLRKRVEDAAAYALAGARFFEGYWVMLERKDEAEALAEALARMATHAGVGVMHVCPDGEVRVLLTALRTTPPDLRSS